MCRNAKGFSFSCGILPRQPLERGPWWPRAGGVAGRRAACCSPNPAALAIACCTAPPVETMPLWLTIMESGRIDGRQERGARGILPELPVTDQGLWHHSPVIPAAPGLGPVTAGAAWRERCCARHRHWQPGNGASPAHLDYIYASLLGCTQAPHCPMPFLSEQVTFLSTVAKNHTSNWDNKIKWPNTRTWDVE